MQMGISGPRKHLEPEGKRDDLIHMQVMCFKKHTAFHPLVRFVGITLIPTLAEPPPKGTQALL